MKSDDPKYVAKAPPMAAVIPWIYAHASRV